jgi:hypothetical protein
VQIFDVFLSVILLGNQSTRLCRRFIPDEQAQTLADVFVIMSFAKKAVDPSNRVDDDDRVTEGKPPRFPYIKQAGQAARLVNGCAPAVSVTDGGRRENLPGPIARSMPRHA